MSASSSEQDNLSCFPPIIGESPRTLILGTMPGQKSLNAAQYYAHPQNQFWRIIEDVYGIKRDLPYEERVLQLTARGVAVWDVVRSCRRAGSMDADIREEIMNDFPSLFERHPSIKKVVFDSLKAEQLYARHVLPILNKHLEYHRVPSPSPAYAKMPYAEKRDIWKRVLSEQF